MSIFPDHEVSDLSSVSTKIVPRARDLGGFFVRRALPAPQRQLVGPFIFFDQMGPAEFKPGEGIDVRPHPHIGLATVTYLFDGKIRHRDSLGTTQDIEPGAVNWMTAGRGITHSERVPDDMKDQSSSMSGIQTWIALPKEKEETAPAFHHHGADTLPEISGDGIEAKLILGDAYGSSSPVQTHSETLYAHVTLGPGTIFPLPDNHEDRGIFVVDGLVEVDGEA